MDLAKLKAIANKMVANNKGLLAADESTGTIAKRLASVKVKATEKNRRDYRELLFRTVGANEFISGTILYDETIRQKAKDGTLFTRIMKDQGILPGIKVDTGAKPLAGSNNEKVTEGLDGLVSRVAEYVKLGAKFAKWRAVIEINKTFPTNYCIDVNTHALARYARICQEGGLVPIVEPEVLMDGDHSIDICQEVTERVLAQTFRRISEQGVETEAIILKPNMVISGQRCRRQASEEEIAQRTITTLKKCVPVSVPGIMFLSGGQSEKAATNNLRAINSYSRGDYWKLSFSYGRALQQSALKKWRGSNKNLQMAQDVFLKRAKENSKACSI